MPFTFSLEKLLHVRKQKVREAQITLEQVHNAWQQAQQEKKTTESALSTTQKEWHTRRLKGNFSHQDDYVRYIEVLQQKLTTLRKEEQGKRHAHIQAQELLATAYKAEKIVARIREKHYAAWVQSQEEGE